MQNQDMFGTEPERLSSDCTGWEVTYAQVQTPPGHRDTILDFAFGEDSKTTCTPRSETFKLNHSSSLNS